MPNVPISALPITTSVCATALVPIVQNGVTCSTYACLLGSGGGGGGVTSIVQGTGICISPACGTGAVTICAIGGGSGVMAAGSGTCSIQGSGCNNIASGNFSFVGGGECNLANALNSIIVGGCCNRLNFACGAFIGGGFCNCSNSECSVISGGFCNNIACSSNSNINGGNCNLINNSSANSSILGGSGNIACGAYTGVFGCNLCNTQPCTFMANNFVVGSFVGCGGCSLALDANGKMCIGSTATPSIMIAGCGTSSSVRCGVNNTALGVGSFSLGGCNNLANGDCSFVANGACNTASCNFGFISNGCCGLSCGLYSNIGNGICNSVTLYCTVCASGPLFRTCDSLFNTIHNGCLNTSCGNFNTIDNGCNNKICGIGIINGSCILHNTILNGCSNIICTSNCVSVLNGGKNCVINGFNTTISGYNNVICGASYSTISNAFSTQFFGSSNFINVLAGRNNTISNSTYGLVAGCQNALNANFQVIFGACHQPNGCHQYYFGEANSNPSSTNYQFAFGCGLCAGASCPMAYFNNVCICGSLSKVSGSFKIPHPDPIKAECGKFLKHSFVESPTAGDNIYRYNVTTSNCSATIELPDYYNLLNGNSHIHVSPDAHFGIAYGKINEENTKVNICSNSDGDYFVLVVGTRKDKLALDAWNGTEVEANEQKK